MRMLLQVRKKKGKTTPKGGGGKGGRKSSTAGKIPVNRRPTILSYTSTLIGPFSGKGYKLEFLPLRPDGTPAPPPAYDDDEHDDDVYMEVRQQDYCPGGHVRRPIRCCESASFTQPLWCLRCVLWCRTRLRPSTPSSASSSRRSSHPSSTDP